MSLLLIVGRSVTGNCLQENAVEKEWLNLAEAPIIQRVQRGFWDWFPNESKGAEKGNEVGC